MQVLRAWLLQEGSQVGSKQQCQIVCCVNGLLLLQAQAEALTTFDSILKRQALVDKAGQEQQLAARFKAVLGFSARLQAFCQSRQYSQILLAHEQASSLIQSHINAAPHSHVDWGALQTLTDQVSNACTVTLH